MKTKNSPRTVHIIFDFDNTLSKEFMENPILEKRGIDPQKFWSKVVELEDEHDGDETTFLSYFLHLMHFGSLKGLTRDELKKTGKDVELFPGVPQFFPSLKEKFRKRANLEFHVVSSGFYDVVEGTCVFPHLSTLYATRFCDTLTKGKEIDSFIEVVVSSKKVEHIKKVCNSKNLSNAIYIGDGLSDIPSFRFVKNRKGLSVMVFDPKKNNTEQRSRMLGDDIIDFAVPADFREGSDLYAIIAEFIESRIQ
jgi:phosphoserine phosphatase